MVASLGGQLFVSSLAILCPYFVPTIIAVARKVRNQGSVVVITCSSADPDRLVCRARDGLPYYALAVKQNGESPWLHTSY
jgi:hypothetical protein